MTWVAFHAPMKPPDHPVPSGDRRMARLLLTALNGLDMPARLVSRLRTRDGAGDAATQARLMTEADAEAQRIAGDCCTDKPAGWFTYHCYYKAPDLIGPTVSRALGIPYVIAEGSRAKKRLDGPWAQFARRAEAALDAADVIFALTPRDHEALERDRPNHQRVVPFAPFVETVDAPPPLPRKRALLTVAMMRAGAKLRSYRALAAALPHLAEPWTLTIVGDGPERETVAAVFAPFGARITLMGAVEGDALRDAYAKADLLVWPGIEEAFGMVYLEAQMAGRPALAENHPGPRSVIDPALDLPPPNDPRAFAAAIERVLSDSAAGPRARAHAAARHSVMAARKTLSEALPW